MLRRRRRGRTRSSFDERTAAIRFRKLTKEINALLTDNERNGVHERALAETSLIIRLIKRDATLCSLL